MGHECEDWQTQECDQGEKFCAACGKEETVATDEFKMYSDDKLASMSSSYEMIDRDRGLSAVSNARWLAVIDEQERRREAKVSHNVVRMNTAYDAVQDAQYALRLAQEAYGDTWDGTSDDDREKHLAYAYRIEKGG